jgi:hypothetical protein
MNPEVPMKRVTIVLLCFVVIFAFLVIKCDMPQSNDKSTKVGYELVQIDCWAARSTTQPPWQVTYPYIVNVSRGEKIRWHEIHNDDIKVGRIMDVNTWAAAKPCSEADTAGNLSGRICSVNVENGYYKYEVTCTKYGIVLDPMIKVPREVYVKGH